MNPAAEETMVEHRFEFGENWARFLRSLDDRRIGEAERSLKEALVVADLHGKRLLDIGSGSGLFSLAARRLGAVVHSFDYDKNSVACTMQLRDRFFPNDSSWTVEQQSVLDAKYMRSLGSFDIVYSWGVLHHTGAMWEAIGNASAAVAPRGKFFIAIYNDQGWRSRVWTRVKRAYNEAPPYLRPLILAGATVRLWGAAAVLDVARGRPFASWGSYAQERGMSPWTDLVDWVGGYPFEVAKPEEVFDFCRARGFLLQRLKTCAGSLGCNEFVFERLAASDEARSSRKGTEANTAPGRVSVDE